MNDLAIWSVRKMQFDVQMQCQISPKHMIDVDVVLVLMTTLFSFRDRSSSDMFLASRATEVDANNRCQTN